MTIATSILFAFLCSLLYLCTLGAISRPVATEEDINHQAAVSGVGFVLVFVLVLWLRLEVA